MNERILKLAKQAGAHWNHGDFNMESSVEFQESDLEKFADLIIKHCILEIGFKSVELLDIDFYPHYQERLKEYFGVEE